MTLEDYKQRRNGQHQSGDGSNKPHFYDFTKYKPGEDYTLDELANTVKAIPINSSFPVIVLIEQEETAPEKELINEEFMLDLVKSTHCCNNKLALIEQMKEK